MESCLFCKIASNELQADVLFETEHVVAFKDLSPQAPVHYLVIPKKHFAHLSAATEQEAEVLGQLMLACARAARETGIEQDGYRVVLNTNSQAGQSVYHIHAHVMGGRSMRWPPG